MKYFNKIMKLSVVSALTAMSGHAAASGFQLMEQNASGLGNAYAGQAAAAENASTIFFNPAGMTYLPGRQVSGTVSLIRPSAKFTNSGASAAPAGLTSPGGNGGDVGSLAALPTGYVSWQLNPRLWLGLGITVPFGLSTEYNAGWVGRFQSRKSEIKTTDINPSIAFKLNDVVSLGAGFSYQKVNVDVSRSAFTGVERASKVDLDDNDSYGFNLGAMFKISPATRIGLSYRSTVEHDLKGTASIAGIGGATVKANVKLPDTLSWAIAHQATPKLELLSDLTYTRWSEIKRVPVITTSAGLASLGIASGSALDTFDFQFKNTYRIGVGANYKLQNDFTLKLGVAYDESPVSAQFRTVTLPDNDRLWFSIGGKYQVNKQATVDFGYAYLYVQDASINSRKGVGASPFQGNVVGNYNNSDVHIFSAQLSYNF